MGGLGSLAQLGNQSIGQSIAYGIGKQQLSDSYDQWKKSLKRGPTYRMIGLRNAGINPILAAGGGIGATSAGSLVMQGKGPSGSASGENPMTAGNTQHLLKASTNAQNTLATKHSAEANLASLRFRLESQDMPRRAHEADFYRTPRGKNVVSMRAYNEALPNSWPGITAKGLIQAPKLYEGSGIQKMLNPQKQTQRLRGIR